MLNSDTYHRLQSDSQPKKFDLIGLSKKEIPAGTINGEVYYNFFQTLDQSLKAITNPIALRVQPVNSKIPYHVHNFAEITIALRGSCTIKMDNQKNIQLNQGDLIIVGTGLPHTVGIVPDKTFILSIGVRQQAFSFNDLDLGLPSMLFSIITDQKYSNGRYMFYRSGQDPVIPGIIDDLTNEYYKNDPQSEQLVHLDLLEIFTRLTRLENQNPSSVKKEKRTHNHLTDILLEIEQHYDTVNLNDLANKFGFNPNYLSEILKQQTGMSFIKLVKLQRVNIAAKYLTYTNASIEQISRKVGYENPSYFYKVFEKYIGMSPALYRSKNQIQAND